MEPESRDGGYLDLGAPETNGVESNGEPGHGDRRTRRASRSTRRNARPKSAREKPSIGEGPPLLDSEATFAVLRAAIQEVKHPLGDPDDPAWLTHRAVMDGLCRREYDGITSRDPGTLDIRADDDGFVVSMSDFGLGTKVSVRCKHLLEVLDALQEGFDRKRSIKVGKLKRGKGADKLKAEEKKALEARAQKR